MFPIVLAAGLSMAAYTVYKKRYRPQKPSFTGPSTKLSRTQVMNHLDSPLPENKSAIWCITLELAWRKAVAEVFQGPIELERHQDLVDRLNASQANWDGLPTDQLQLVVKQVRDDAYLQVTRVSGHLKARVPFTIPFFENPLPLNFGVGDDYERVSCFGLGPGPYLQLRRQVSVLFDDGGHFALDPCRTSHPFRLILAAVPPQASLQQTIESVRDRCRHGHQRTLGSQDSLLIPNQSWDIQHHFRELSGVLVRPPYGGTLDISQQIRFQLDRSGAELLSQVDLLAAFMKCGPPRQYHFSHPFLLYLESRASGQVVFAAWIQNSELLIPAGRAALSVRQ